MKSQTLDRMLAAHAARQPVVRLVDLASGAERVLTDDADTGDGVPAEAWAALADGRSRTIAGSNGDMLVQALLPPLRLFIIGAVHIAQPLARMAALCGYAVSIIDPRRGFAARPGFDGVEIVTDWPDEALARLAPDGRTAIVTLTHDPKLDDPALATALRSPAFYVGALGSRRTQAQRRDRLAAQGFAEADLHRVHGPVGLPIGAITAAEIAVSIIADITRVRRGGLVT